jgi:hypothetical protein
LSFFIIFIIILFLYVHIIAQYKKSEDLEIYETDYKSNDVLQEICELKQPIIININNVPIDTNFLSYKNDIRVYDIHKTPSYVVLPFEQFHTLINTTPSPQYYTENNTIDDEIDLNDIDLLLKPYYTCQTIYDIWTGTRLVNTPLRYHINYRQYLYVTTGKIHVKMTPYKSRKYLHPEDDYESYEFRSPVNPFHPQSQYMHDMDKLKFLEFDVHAGYILYIPPYWWYSIRYAADSFDKKETVVISVIYNTIMNKIANLPSIVRYYLQLQNTKNIFIKTIQPIYSQEEGLEKRIEKRIEEGLEEGLEERMREKGQLSEIKNDIEKGNIESLSVISL